MWYYSLIPHETILGKLKFNRRKVIVYANIGQLERMVWEEEGLEKQRDLKLIKEHLLFVDSFLIVFCRNMLSCVAEIHFSIGSYCPGWSAFYQLVLVSGINYLTSKFFLVISLS